MIELRTAAAILAVSAHAATAQAPSTPPAAAALEPGADAAAILDALEQRRHAALRDTATTLTRRGRCTLQPAGAEQAPVAGTWSEHASGERFARDVRLEEIGRMAIGYDGRLAWEIDPEDGARTLDDSAASRVRRLYGLAPWSTWRAHYRDARVEATDDGGEGLRIALTPLDGGPPDTWHLDAGRQRVVGVTVHRGGGERARPVQVRFSDFEEHGGVSVAGTATVHAGPLVMTLHTDHVELGGPVAAADVALPADVSAAFAKMRSGGDTGDALEVVEIAPRPVLSIRSKVEIAKIGSALAIALPEVMRHLTERGIPPAGAPFSRYHSAGDPIDLEAGIPVAAAEPEGAGRIEAGTLPGGRVVRAWHIGPYHDLPQTYARVQKWIAEQGLSSAGPFWEMYWSDPGLEPNPAHWRTEVYWPVASAKR